MYMKKLDINWAKSQIEQAKVPVDVGISVVKLLEVWSTLNHEDSNDNKVTELFSLLACSVSIVESPSDEIWEAARPGFVRVGDEVRVMADAFEGELGQLHNGRRGRVVAVRYGDIIIKTTDGKEPVLDGSHYSPYKLEKLIAIL
jgi:hypothetical protein